MRKHWNIDENEKCAIGLGLGGRVGDCKTNIMDCLQPSTNTETKKYPGIFCLFRIV